MSLRKTSIGKLEGDLLVFEGRTVEGDTGTCIQVRALRGTYRRV